MSKSLSDLDRVLTAHGYAIKKSSLTPKRVQGLRSALTVAPQMPTKFSRETDASFTVYSESPSRFYVPRWWGAEEYGIAEANAVPEGLSLSADHGRFVGNPYDYQEAIIDKFMKAGANGLICVPCGKGKTFMALAIAARLRHRFLVIVDKEFLMNQWRGEMKALMPNLRVGILQGNRFEVEPEEYDCTICMIQTLIQRKFPEDTFRTYGFAIFDECHHLGAAHFSRSLLKVQTRHMLGLSATPVRDDGLTKVFEWFLGKPVYWEKTREPDQSVVVKCVEFTTEDAAYNDVPTDWRGEMVMARLLTRVVECEERNQLLAKLIRDICGEDEGRRVLVLSERKAHLNRLEELLTPSGLTMSYYIGGMKEEVRETGAQTARVLLATYSMASEAMNIKTLNSVILASPRKKVEQSTGRILRLRPEQRQHHPVIVDVVDSQGVYKGQWRKRAAYYRKCGYRIQTQKGAEAESAVVEEAEEKPKDGCLIMDSGCEEEGEDCGSD